MLEVSNEQFEAAWASVENRKIIAKVSRNFHTRVPSDELRHRGYLAMFNCLRKHDPSYKTRFTSSLYRHMTWECQQAVREQGRKLPPLAESDGLTVEQNETALHVRDCLSSLPECHAAILISYYFDNMTLEEIGKANGYTSPAAFYNLKKAKEAFRRLYGED